MKIQNRFIYYCSFAVVAIPSIFNIKTWPVLKKLFFILSGLLFFCSCKKNTQGAAPRTAYSDSSFSQVFEGFWTGMNNNMSVVDRYSELGSEYRFFKPMFADRNDRPLLYLFLSQFCLCVCQLGTTLLSSSHKRMDNGIFPNPFNVKWVILVKF